MRTALRIKSSLRMLRPPMPPSSVCRPPKDARRIPSPQGCDRGDQSAHIQRSSDLGSTSPHATMAVQSARVAFERSDPNQGGHSLVRERAQSSATPARAACGLGDRGPTADTLRRSASFSPNVWAALDGRLQVALGARELLLEPPDVSLDAFGHRLGCRAQAIVLGGYHRE